MSISSVFLPKELLLWVVRLLQKDTGANLRKTECLSHKSKVHTNTRNVFSLT